MPDKTKSEYESLLGWKDFMYIVEANATKNDEIELIEDHYADYKIYTLGGALVRSVKASSYREAVNNLKPDIYIINGIKVFVR